MAGLGGGIWFDDCVDVTVVGDTVLTLAAGVDVLRVTSATATPAIQGIIGGTANRTILLANVSGASIDIDDPISATLTDVEPSAQFGRLVGGVITNGSVWMLHYRGASSKWHRLGN